MESKTKEKKTHECTLEHIYPVSPAPDEWGGEDNQNQMEEYLWHLGNLTMLGERLNAKVKNQEFGTKKVYYAKRSELVMARQIAKDHSKWDVDEIKKRAKKLVKMTNDIWDFDNPSRV